MRRSSFHRARGFGTAPKQLWWFHVVALLSAIWIPLLIVDLGLIVELLISRGAHVDRADWVLGPWVEGQIIPWPFFDSYVLGLMVLLGVGCLLSGFEALTLWYYSRLVHRSALRSVVGLKAEIRAQAFRLGPNDLLSDRRSRPEELFSDKAEALRLALVHWRQSIPRAPVNLAMLLILALAVNFWLTVLALLLAVCLWRFHSQLRARTRAGAQRWLESAQQRHTLLLETFRLAPLISGYSLPETPGERFEASLAQYEAAAFKSYTREIVVRPLLLFLVLVSVAFFLFVVGVRQDASVAGSVVLATALLCAYFPAAHLYLLSERLAEVEHAAAEIFAYLDREPSVGQVADAKPLDRLQKEIRVEDVTLADRAGRQMLHEVKFSVPAGKRIAIIASDGQTPIALAGLFVRFYDPAAGSILYDDHDIRKATLDTVRGQSIFVPRDGSIFAGTVAENIACGDVGFTTHQIHDAARRTGVLEFVQQLPQQFSTMIGEHHRALTADQAFRIGLARALLREPSLLILEEPAVDHDEAVAGHLDASFQAVAQGRTVILLASRLATLRSADAVLVFHQGKLVAQGKHAELLQSSELYRHLNYMRFNPFRNG